jgi:hypothetical protein
MKKLIGLGIVAALLLAIPLANQAIAKSDKADAGKVWICHATGRISDGTVENVNGVPIPEGDIVGQIIEVSGNAVKAHCAHGDKVFPTYDGPGGLCNASRGAGNNCP